MSTISQICDRAMLIAMAADNTSQSRWDNDAISELLYPSVMKKVIIDAGNDPYKSKDVRITQNISVTSGVGTLPTNVALECIETANVLATGAATWATSDVSAAAALVAGAGTSAADGTYTYRGQYNGKGYYNLVGEPDNDGLSSIRWTVGTGWVIMNALGTQQLYVNASDTDVPWGTFTEANGASPPPAVTEVTGRSRITFTGHAFTTGDFVTLSTSGTLPAPFVVNTRYYVIVVGDNTISLAASYADAIAGTYIRIASVGAGTGTITPQTLPPASYVRDYNDYLGSLPSVFSYWTTQGGSFYYRLVPSQTARARAAFTGTIPFNSVVFPIISSNEVSIVAGTSLASDIVDDIVAELASAIRGEVSIKEATSAA